jgi:hypothetical protein
MQRLIALFGLVILISCNDEAELDTDIFQGNPEDVVTVDTFKIISNVQESDSLVAFEIVSVDIPQLNRIPQVVHVGRYSDPLFGQVQSDIYLQFTRATSSPPPDFENSNIVMDSLALLMTYDTASHYGEYDQMITIEASSLSEAFDRNFVTGEPFTIYSDEDFASGSLKSFSFIPSPKDSVTYSEPTRDGMGRDTLMDIGHARLLLQEQGDLGIMQIFEDPEVYENDSIFRDRLKGLKLSSLMGNSLVGFRPEASVSRLSAYYTQDDTLHKRVDFVTSAFLVRLSSVEIDPTGTLSEQFILNDENESDSLIFVQGLTGYTTRLDIPGLASLEGNIINFAELELTLAELPGDDPFLFPPIDLMTLSYRNDNNTLILVTDLTLGLANELEFFGGRVETTPDNQLVYKMRITDHIQRMISGEFPQSLELQAFSRRENPRRSVLYGGNHSTYPIKLNVTFTKP